MQKYTPLIRTNSSRSSIVTLDALDNIQLHHSDQLCHVCRNKLMKKQKMTHTPMECLSQRCELLENEVIRLKDHDMRSCLQIKELENKIIGLEDAIKGLIAPKQELAAPYSFGTGHKHRQQLKKAQSEERSARQTEINYDNILQPKRSNSREHVGLFGSLGASSQYL